MGRKHSSHTKKARTILGATVAKGTKRTVTRTGANERTVKINSGGKTYTRTISRSNGKKVRSAWSSTPNGSTTTPGNGDNSGTSSGPSKRKTRILTRNAARINDGYTPGEFANVKNKSKRKMLIRNAKRKNSSSSNSGNSSSPGNDNS